MAKVAQKDKEILERIEEPEGYTGYGLYDPLEQRIGEVEMVFVSEFGEPQYIKVKVEKGLFRSRSILLPVERVAVGRDRVALILQ